MREAPASGPSAPSDSVFLNRKAWAIRWTSRATSSSLARDVLQRQRESRQRDPVAAGLALRTLAWQARYRGDFEAAHALCLRARKRLEGSAEISALADLHATLAVVHFSRLRRDLALAEIDQGFELLGNDPHLESRTDLKISAAVIVLQNGRLDRAYELCHEAMEMAEGREFHRAQHMLARFLLMDDSPSEAISYALPALIGARRYEARVLLPYALEVLATCYVMLDQPVEARGYLDEGLAVAREDDDQRAQCQLLEQSALLALAEGDRSRALKHLQHGLGISKELGYPMWQKRYLRHIGGQLESQGDREAAFEVYKTLLKLIDEERV